LLISSGKGKLNERGSGLKSIAFSIILLIFVLSVSICAQSTSVAWQGNLATISWDEAMTDPSAQANEVPFTVYKGPYLIRLSDTLLVVGWQTVAVTQQTFNASANVDSLIKNTDKSKYTVELPNLNPATAYQYKLVCNGSGYSYEGSVLPITTNPDPNERVTWDGNLAIIRWDECLADPDAPPGEAPFSIMTGPYLGELTANSVSIGWEAAALASPVKVEMDDNGAIVMTKTYRKALDFDSLVYFDLRKIRLTGLNPNTDYRYVLYSDNGTYHFESDTFAFRTYATSVTLADPFRFAVLGDTRSTSTLTNLNLDNMAAWNPQLWMNNGDIISTANSGFGAAPSSKTSWMGILNASRLLGSRTLHVPTMGNWDINTKEGYLGVRQMVHDYFFNYPVTVNAAGRSHPPYYYSYDAAGIHFVALCSEYSTNTRVHYDGWTGNEMFVWLEEDLKNTSAEWKIVHFHHPNMISNKADNLNEALGSILNRYGVQLVFKASDHTYKRSFRKKMAADGKTIVQNDSGFVEVVSGAGGHRSLSYADYGTTYYDSTCRNCTWDNQFFLRIVHHLRLSVYPDEIHVLAVDSGLNVFDAWRLPKIGQPELLDSALTHVSEEAPPGSDEELVIHPNPFNPVTVVRYLVPSTQRVDFAVYDPAGRLIHALTGIKQKGYHLEKLNFSIRPSGIYLLKIAMGRRILSKPLLFMK
jgi:hypothetical protein